MLRVSFGCVYLRCRIKMAVVVFNKAGNRSLAAHSYFFKVASPGLSRKQRALIDFKRHVDQVVFALHKQYRRVA